MPWWPGCRQIDYGSIQVELNTSKLDQTPHFCQSPTYTFVNVCVTLNQEFTFSAHIHHLCLDCYYQLRQPPTIFRSLKDVLHGSLAYFYYCCYIFGYMLDVLHWLPSSCSSLAVSAPTYLCELCCPSWATRGRSYLHSVERRVVLLVPFTRTSMKQWNVM